MVRLYKQRRSSRLKCRCAFCSSRRPPTPAPAFYLSHSCLFLLSQKKGRSVYFLGSKSESLYKQRKNPRKIAWTVLYRRKHRKGISEESSKKRTRRTQKFTRAIEVC